MVDNDNKVRVSIANSFHHNRPVQRRVASIVNGSRVNGWVIGDVSKRLSSESEEKLTAFLRQLTSAESVPHVTSVEILRNWANAPGGCRIGDLVAMNVPVCCIGCLTNSQDMREMAQTRDGYSEDLPEHMRWSAHGYTFGSVYLKTFNGTENDGSRFVKEVKMVVLCNNCLDIWVGPVKQGGERSTGLFPFKPRPRGHDRGKPGRDEARRGGQRRDKHSAKPKRETNPRRGGRKDTPAEPVKDKKIEAKSSTALEFIVSRVQSDISSVGNTRDPWRKVTVTALNSYLEQEGVEARGQKADLVAALSRHLVAKKDQGTLDVIASKISERGN